MSLYRRVVGRQKPGWLFAYLVHRQNFLIQRGVHLFAAKLSHYTQLEGTA